MGFAYVIKLLLNAFSEGNYVSAVLFCTLHFTKHNPANEIAFQDLALSAGIIDMLGQPGQYTLFAPTNEAFEKLGSDVLDRLKSNKEVLKGNPDFYF